MTKFACAFTALAITSALNFAGTDNDAHIKHLGSRTQYASERTSAIWQAFRQVMSSDFTGDASDVFAAVARSESPRFWCSEENAAAMFTRIERGDDLGRMRGPKRAMFEEIHRRMRALAEHRPEMPIRLLAAEVIAQPAPEFYMAPKYVRDIICREIREGKGRAHSR